MSEKQPKTAKLLAKGANKFSGFTCV